MLGKLIKYEFKATGRCLIPLYSALLGLAILLRIIFKAGLDEKINSTFGTLGNIANMICVFAYGFTMAAVFVATLFIIIQRFHKNILGDEGYLMNTLPVKPYLNIINKVLVSAVWTIISCFIAFLSILILFTTFSNIFDFLSELIHILVESYSNNGLLPYLLLFELFIACFIGLINPIIMIYASMSIGHLFNKSKILLSFMSFIGLSIISNIINSILMYIFTNGNFTIFDSPTLGTFGLILLLSIIIESIYFAIYFFITNYILNNKLNLE